MLYDLEKSWYHWEKRDTVDGSELLHHLGCIKPCKQYDIYHVNISTGESRISEPSTGYLALGCLVFSSSNQLGFDLQLLTPHRWSFTKLTLPIFRNKGNKNLEAKRNRMWTTHCHIRHVHNCFLATYLNKTFPKLFGAKEMKNCPLTVPLLETKFGIDLLEISGDFRRGFFFEILEDHPWVDVSIPCTIYLPGSEGFVLGTVIPPLIGNPYKVNFPSGSNHLLRIVMEPNISLLRWLYTSIWQGDWIGFVVAGFRRHKWEILGDLRPP